MIATRVLIDAGPMVAMLSAADQQHQRCVEQAKELVDSPVTCWPVITEAAYLLRSTPGAVTALLSRIELRAIEVLALTETDVPSISAILRKYHDQGFDLADACLMHLADREGINHIFTIDRRHFSVYQPTSTRLLTLIPTA